MPRESKKLTDKAISHLKPKAERPYSKAVGGVPGLHIQVTPAGHKSWLLRYTEPGTGRDGIPQHRREMGLGSYPETGLKEAREKAEGIRRQIAEGIDPVEQRKAQRSALATEQARAITFEEATRKWLEMKALEWKSPKDFPLHTRRFENFIFPTLGAVQLCQIKSADLIKVLEPIWLEKADTAKKLRGCIHNVFDWAAVRGLVDGPNPTPSKAQINTVAGNASRIVKSGNRAALPYATAPTFMATLRACTGMAARALEFVILTAARSSEARKVTWAEFDLEGKVWTVPAERMKAGKEHRVPLSETAVQLLRDLPRLKDNELVFPAPRGRALSDGAMPALVKRMHEAKVKAGGKGYLDPKQDKIITPHGFRSTFRDWAAEATDYANEVVEMALAHTIKNKAEAAYRRGDLFEKRQGLMADWAAYCEG